VALLSFPDPVNDTAARVVAGGVVAMAATSLLTGRRWLLAPLAYGFVARVATGPTLSPLGRLATQVVAPRLGPARPVPGPPKRFAQGIGAVVTTGAAVAELRGAHRLATAGLLAITAAASLEAGLGLCLGCQAFRVLMRAGVIPDSACESCADIWSRPPAEAA
jgi:hypothetical protein